MTRKDYIKFADMFAGLLARGRSENRGLGWSRGVRECMRLTADIFEDDNPRFDVDRFREACEPKSEARTFGEIRSEAGHEDAPNLSHYGRKRDKS